MNIFDSLIKIANDLDKEDLIKEADMVEEVIIKIAQEEDSYLLTRLAQVNEYDDAIEVLNEYAAEQGRRYREFLQESKIDGNNYSLKELKQQMEFGLSVEWQFSFAKELEHKIYNILESFNKKRTGGIGDDDEPYNNGKVWNDVNNIMRYFVEGVMKGNRGRRRADNFDVLEKIAQDMPVEDSDPNVIDCDNCGKVWNLNDLTSWQETNIANGGRCPDCALPNLENTTIETWFERDRAHVELRDKRTDKTLMEFWDDDVRELVEDGFLDPKNWHQSMLEYYNHLHGGK